MRQTVPRGADLAVLNGMDTNKIRGRRGHLTRAASVRLVNFSWSGCLIEINRPVEPGTKARLRIRRDGKEYQDTVNIVRKVEHHGSPYAFALGGQFGWRERLTKPSIRNEVPSILTVP